MDRIRFDAMDKNWSVKNSPHHFHPRFELEGYFSPMTGDPKVDIPKLVEFIKSHILEDSKHRFH
ncbi:MAG: hypothetical protein JW776_16765 [Candidatus Lokiarchaeota archaeon]|nr:hypothetical protein [Candidatus Lokiarchaeota archaeon]